MSIYQKETNFESDNSESMPIENDKGETAKLIPQIGAEGPVVPLSSSKLEPGTSNGGAPGEGQDALPSSTIPEVVESKGAAGRESQVALSSTKSPKSAAPNGRASAQDQPAPPSKGPKLNPRRVKPAHERKLPHLPPIRPKTTPR